MITLWLATGLLGGSEGVVSAPLPDTHDGAPWHLAYSTPKKRPRKKRREEEPVDEIAPEPDAPEPGPRAAPRPLPPIREPDWQGIERAAQTAISRELGEAKERLAELAEQERLARIEAARRRIERLKREDEEIALLLMAW